MLADKINGTYVGLWLLLPEHLRLGTWDILKMWSGGTFNENEVEPRLALQMVHEAALCVNGIRHRRTLRQKGFETLNGLPFVATDQAIHELLQKHTMIDAQLLQRHLGKIRLVRSHYGGRIILMDPHRIETWSRRQFPPRKSHFSAGATKKVQTFFAIDADSGQPYCFGMGSTSVTASHATIGLVGEISHILNKDALLVCDAEHFAFELIKEFNACRQFSLLVPMSRNRKVLEIARSLKYKPQWAGYAVAESEYKIRDEKLRLIVQRTGEKDNHYDYKPFLTTSTMNATDLMTLIFPQRWDIEEFFKMEESLGWNRASTLNMNIRYNKLTMALIAQAALYELRKKLPKEIRNWTAECMAQKFFGGIDGDIRVKNETIMVTFYNAPNVDTLKLYYEKLPEKLEHEGVDPRVPWLYNYKVDFRFR